MKKFLISLVAIVIFFAGNFTYATIFQSNSVPKNIDEIFDYILDKDKYDDDKYTEDAEDEPETTNIGNGDYQDFAVEVLILVNEEREKAGVAPLRLADDLQQATAIRAREIIQYLSHTRPDGSDCFTVMRNRGRTCGENIAAGHASASETVEQWMNSEGHRENILNPDFRELGVGYAYEDYSTYHHYWVQIFRG